LAQLGLNLLWFVIFFDAKKPRTAQLENAGNKVLQTFVLDYDTSSSLDLQCNLQ